MTAKQQINDIKKRDMINPDANMKMQNDATHADWIHMWIMTFYV